MKLHKFITFSMLCLALVACKKSTTTKINYDFLKQPPAPLNKELQGYRCDVISEDEHKETFISTKEPANSRKEVTLHNYMDSRIISVSMFKIGDFSVAPFKMNAVSLDGKTRSDKTIVLNSYGQELLEEGKFVFIDGYLTLDKNMNGVIEYDIYFMREDNSTGRTERRELAKIENCKAEYAETLI